MLNVSLLQPHDFVEPTLLTPPQHAGFEEEFDDLDDEE